MNPISAARVYNSVSLSGMFYGVEVSEVYNSALRSLEDVHWDIGKRIQGLNGYTPTPSVIQSIPSILYERRLGLFGRILSLEPNSIYKNVAIICMYQSIFQQTEVNIGPTHRTLPTAKIYGLVKTIYQVVETGQMQID